MGSDARPRQADRHGPLVRGLHQLAGQLQGFQRTGFDRPGQRGHPYRLDFPELSIEDVADAAFEVVRGLGIEQVGSASSATRQCRRPLALLLRHPGTARAHINISGSAQALPFSIAIRSPAREAIRLDPNWNGGQYTDETYPESGMRMARKLGHHLPFGAGMGCRFGRVRLDSDRADDDPFGLEFEVELPGRPCAPLWRAASTPIATCI